ncbi:DJ-1/PfpI family protein [Streptomyces coelicoflavus]|uniref:DJ-1/PfpI family protein n=1 Tax=Streptomyces TaxID=1883 RepID=UPI001291B1FF|nr:MULTISPECIES: DJ-1/PfpI family protein [Streptomyces]MBQ0952982.1 DJ-1/PfpI family protein [Streptomyces sp. RK76]MDI6520360.1 DJ-1/PfpI family protein [Streptomyces coelicoflavus]QFX86759.1 DJ-1/PfpI family protein [Streptomyces sp. SYP-A7193]
MTEANRWGAAPSSMGSAPRVRGDHPLRVHIVVFDGVEELDVFGPLQVFGATAAMGLPVEFRLVTGGRPGPVRARFGTRIDVPHSWDPSQADVIAVPGGGFRLKDGPGIWAEIEDGRLPRLLREAAAHERLTLYGLCTGVVLLHEAGVIGNRPCTTHIGARSYLRDRGADVRDARVVDDGALVSAGGVSAGIDGALRLVERAFGSGTAARTERYLEFERRGTVVVTSG